MFRKSRRVPLVGCTLCWAAFNSLVAVVNIKQVKHQQKTKNQHTIKNYSEEAGKKSVRLKLEEIDALWNEAKQKK